MKLPNVFRRLFNFITFTDIPIWQKIMLFAGGGIAWFVVIALIGLVSVSYVNDASRALTDQIVPQIQASQKVIINIRGGECLCS